MKNSFKKQVRIYGRQLNQGFYIKELMKEEDSKDTP